ncbi:MAG: hypothetical protein P8X83_04320, partial [Nitrosopumilaceae archaeon]
SFLFKSTLCLEILVFTITPGLYFKNQIPIVVSYCLFCPAKFDDPKDLAKHALNCKVKIKKK